MDHSRCIRTVLLFTLLVPTAVAQFDPTAPEPIPQLKGTLFLGGGGELPAEVYDRFVELAGGEDAKLVVLSVGQPADSTLGLLRARKTASLQVIHNRSRLAANSPEFGAPLREATGVWIDGDDGTTFAEVFQGTAVESALRGMIARSGVVGSNGGTSRALAKVMITAGNPHAAVGIGLDLVPGSVIDDHFDGMDRRNRLLGVLAAQPTLVGLGIEQDTALVLHQRFIDVLGKGSVHGCIAANEKWPVRITRINGEISPASQKRPPNPRPASQQTTQTTNRGTGRGQRQGRRQGQRGRRGQRAGGQRGRGQRARGQTRGQRGQRGQGQANQPRAWRPRRLADLIAFSRNAQDRVAPKFPAYSPEPPNVASGTLIIVGGGGSPPGLTERFIELAGGPDAPLVFVPCEERETITSEPGILGSWRRAGAKNVSWIHTKDRNKSNNDEEILSKLREARGVWFGGGRQWNLVDSYQNTTAHKLFEDVLARGGVIGGSSAGASIQTAYMPRGNPLGNRDSTAFGYETGLGFLTGVAVDQHFTQRNRLRDMTELVDLYPELLGIGLDEASSIIVQGSVAEVFTREGRNVLVYDRNNPVVPGEPDYTTLVHGQRFDLKDRKLLEPVKDK